MTTGAYLAPGGARRSLDHWRDPRPIGALLSLPSLSRSPFCRADPKSRMAGPSKVSSSPPSPRRLCRVYPSHIELISARTRSPRWRPNSQRNKQRPLLWPRFGFDPTSLTRIRTPRTLPGRKARSAGTGRAAPDNDAVLQPRAIATGPPLAWPNPLGGLDRGSRSIVVAGLTGPGGRPTPKRRLAQPAAAHGAAVFTLEPCAHAASAAPPVPIYLASGWPPRGRHARPDSRTAGAAFRAWREWRRYRANVQAAPKLAGLQPGQTGVFRNP